MRTNKRRTRARDPLLTEIEQELCLGQFVERAKSRWTRQMGEEGSGSI